MPRKDGSRVGSSGSGSSPASGSGRSSADTVDDGATSHTLTAHQIVVFSREWGMGKDQVAKSYIYGGGPHAHLKPDSPFAGTEAGGGTRVC
jgi:hypothetical protein